MSTDAKKDFFVSYNRHDKAWAEWIAWILEESGYTVVIQAWDFRPGGNFVLDMHDAIDNTRRTIAVLSPNYLRSEFAQPEWAAAFVQDPKGKNRTLIPVRVEACELTGLLRAIVYVDLVGVAKAEAQELLLRAVSDERTKPSRSSEFPQLGIPANLPLANQLFVGREQALEELHLQVRSRELTAISSIKGMGGIGKTELALQYALKHLKAQNYPGGVCWLKAREDIGLQIVQFAREKLGMIPPDDRELVAQVEWCWINWQKAATLIVFDDVQAYADIQPFLPKHRDQFRVLLTTRKYLDRSVRNYEIQVLSETASLELLRWLVSDGRIDRELETAKQVCEWLGYLPLGLELVGRYLARKQGCSVAKLWERLQEQQLAAKALLETEAGMTATLNVTAAFELSWQELDEDAKWLAAFLSLFAPSEIPWSLIQQSLLDMEDEDLEELRDGQLVNSSLLIYVSEERYEVHQLLREFLSIKRLQMRTDEVMKYLFCEVMVANSKKIPQVVTLELINQLTPVIPHLKEAATTLNPWLTDDDVIIPSNRIARFYDAQFAFEEAEEWYLLSRELAIQRFGQNHLSVAQSSNNLAGLYQSQGRYEEAELLHLQSLEIYQQHLGHDHPNTAISLNNLAVLYGVQGRYTQAEPLYLKALEISQREFGQDHPEVAASLNNLAALYDAQGRYDKAEPLYWQAVQICQKHLGQNHPYVAASLNNLGGLYELQGRFPDAEMLYLEALEIYRKAFGEKHPNFAQSLNNLAEVYRSQKRYTEAEPLYLQALEIWEQQLGENYPDIAKSLNNLAELYRSQKRYAEMELLFLRALHINKGVFGEDYPDTAILLNNLAGLYSVLKRYREAELMSLQAIWISKKGLGETHPNTQTFLENFRTLLHQIIQGDRTSELSDHPLTRSLLQQLQNEES